MVTLLDVSAVAGHHAMPAALLFIFFMFFILFFFFLSFFFFFFYIFFSHYYYSANLQIQHFCLYSVSPTLLLRMMPRPPAPSAL